MLPALLVYFQPLYLIRKNNSLLLYKQSQIKRDSILQLGWKAVVIGEFLLVRQVVQFLSVNQWRYCLPRIKGARYVEEGRYADEGITSFLKYGMFENEIKTFFIFIWNFRRSGACWSCSPRFLQCRSDCRSPLCSRTPLVFTCLFDKGLVNMNFWRMTNRLMAYTTWDTKHVL